MRSRPLSAAGTVVLTGALAVVLSGCPLKLEEESGNNQAPNTFFDRPPPRITAGGVCSGRTEGDQAHTSWITFSNEVTFSWQGTDLDSDVVAYQYQLVETDALYFQSGGLQGEVLTSLAPRSVAECVQCDETSWRYGNGDCVYTSLDDCRRNKELWTERLTSDFETFRDLDDGYYEFRARAIDGGGSVDQSPAKSRFEVFFDDIPPQPVIVNSFRCGRIGSSTGFVFEITATDASRTSITPRSRLEYSVRLRSDQPAGCPEHSNDSFTDWTCFPSDDPNEIIRIGEAEYQDLFSRNCSWTFEFRVRDPAGLISVNTSCQIKTE